MNTEGEKIQWHPAFDAALQIELGEEAKYLTFEPEHLLSKKPMQIDVLVKNEKKVKIRKILEGFSGSITLSSISHRKII